MVQNVLFLNIFSKFATFVDCYTHTYTQSGTHRHRHKHINTSVTKNRAVNVKTDFNRVTVVRVC